MIEVSSSNTEFLVAIFMAGLSGLTIRIMLTLVKQKWVATYHHTMSYILLPLITFTITKVIIDGGACTTDLCVFDDDLAASVNANMTALLVDVLAGTISIDCADAYNADDGFLVAYSDGSGNTRIGVLVSNAANSANTDAVVEGADVLILSGVDVDDLVDTNFGNWQ